MKGGYQILDLSNITLVEDVETSISDKNILDQLLKLTDFLNKDGLIDKQLKPILIITKDSAGYASITNISENTLIIEGLINGTNLKLNVVYSSSLDDYGNTVYTIGSAKYNYTYLDNAKPIYCHPVYIKLNRAYDSAILEITMLIFNNQEEAFTKTTWKNWCQKLFEDYPTAKILISGFYKQTPVCCLLKSATPTANFKVITAYGDTSSTDFNINWSDVELETTIFEDGVNKIN